MSACERFEREGLAALDAGEALDPHFDDCAECRAARAAHARLAAALPRVGARYTPRGDWEARVLAAVARERPSRGRLVAWLAAALVAVAAAVLLFPRGAAELPVYGLSVSAGESPVRSGDTVQDAPVLGPGSALTVVLQPEGAVTGPVAVGAWALGPAGLRALAAAPEVAASGGARVRVEAGDPALVAGPITLVFAVAPAGAQPDAAAVQRALDTGTTDGWRLLRQPVVVRGP